MFFEDILGMAGSFGSNMYTGHDHSALGFSTAPPPPSLLSWDRHPTHRLFRGGVEGLMYLHSIGITHSDVKPGNFLTDQGMTTLKITDLGFSGRECLASLDWCSRLCGASCRCRSCRIECSERRSAVGEAFLCCIAGASNRNTFKHRNSK